MIFAIIFIALIALELLYFRIAERFGIVDKPNLRSSHTSVTLRGGGIIFLVGAWLFWAIFGPEYSWFVLGLTLLGVVSFIDDIRSLPDSVRLVAQFTAMFLMFYQLDILTWQGWWMVAVALVVCVGIVNAYNFMDGINGITGGYSLAVLAPLVYLNATAAEEFIAMPYLYVTGLSLLVFCYFNFRTKAKCFAGDAGSISIAFILLFAIGRLIIQTQDLSYIIFLWVYGADTVLTICHRILLHENLGQAHRKHAYQLMTNELGLPHVAVSSLYMAMQLLISAGLIFLPVDHYLYAAIVTVILVAAYLLFMKKNYRLHEAYLKSKSRQA